MIKKIIVLFALVSSCFAVSDVTIMDLKETVYYLMTDVKKIKKNLGIQSILSNDSDDNATRDISELNEKMKQAKDISDDADTLILLKTGKLKNEIDNQASLDKMNHQLLLDKIETLRQKIIEVEYVNVRLKRLFDEQIKIKNSE